MTDNLIPAEDLARRSPVRFPNESVEYRAARPARQAAGVELGGHQEPGAAARRAQPPRGGV